MEDNAVFISALLLAAGESKRMGRQKLLLPFGASTIIEQTISNLLNSKVDEVIVVVGYREKELVKRIASKPIKIAVNPQYHQGVSTSIIAGLNLIDKRAKAVMIALADQPGINSKVIDKLIQEFHRHNKGIGIPTYRGNRGHPVIFSIKYKGAFLKLTGDVGGREIIGEHRYDILEIPVDSKGINVDVDTLSDYEQLIPRR
ncbi:unnamed protein product [marine sediment metagenome]|uniref:MobA-like NTP transferase domain-containing protein n=1 Tax=marine sediment metagenome TaxID=412755 RepID=X1KMH1_9ZZZZ